jgi:import inner membrane translocase subunit TIM54
MEVMIDGMRGKMAVREWPGPAGDIVVGRNTWKEYVRGLHEGWLGPVDMPEEIQRAMNEPENTEAEPVHAQPSEPTTSQDTLSASRDEAASTLETIVIHDSAPSTTDDEKKAAEDKKKAEEEAAAKKKKKKPQPLPFISTSQYSSAALPPSLPAELPPTTIITFPHLLGFLNTPIRIYRYLTQRKLADEVGREAAAACFAAYRPFERSSGPAGSSPFAEDEASPSSAPHQEEGQAPTGDLEIWEQEGLLKHEESNWHKSVRKNHDPTKESVWVDTMVLDPRIAGRMRRFFVDDADVERGLELQATKEREDERLAEEKEADKKLPSPQDVD